MEKFWALTRGDYKVEVYKILDEISYSLKPPHQQFFFNALTETPADRLSMEDFTCMSGFGKFAKDEEFKKKVTAFFWRAFEKSE